jgi:hypothetical protein
MFHKWSTDALIKRRKEVVEYIKQCKAYEKELKSLNTEILNRKINIG